MINTKKDRKNLYMQLDRLQLINRLKPLLDRAGYKLRIEDGKFVPGNPALGHDSPWVYVKSMDDNARCDVYHKVFYNLLDHIPSRCRKCWKVVIRPQTVVQLFDLYEYEVALDKPCKCGIELRKTVSGGYGGYFYNRSKEEGLERWAEVREWADAQRGPKMPVILKRYCTEFELGGQGGIKGQGPSDKTPDCTQEELDMEDYIIAHFPPVGFEGPQPEHVQAAVMQRWIRHAFEIGDLTYLELTGGEKLTADYVTYHPKEE